MKTLRRPCGWLEVPGRGFFTHHYFANGSSLCRRHECRHDAPCDKARPVCDPRNCWVCAEVVLSSRKDAPAPSGPSVVAVTGSRDFPSPDVVYGTLSSLRCGLMGKRGRVMRVVVGDCPTGADAMTLFWCNAVGVPCEVKVADWKTWGKAAGPMRNRDVVCDADMAVGFRNAGLSRGTDHTISEAKKFGIPAWVVGPDGGRVKA